MILDCKKTEQTILNNVKLDNELLIAKGYEPCLALIRVLGDDASGNYVSRKTTACENTGLKHIYCEFPEDVSEETVSNKIMELNNDENVHAIILQLPLPKHLNEHKLINLIEPDKDVDCLTEKAIGRLYSGNGIAPCTPYGAIKVLETNGVDLTGKDALIINRSLLVGKPLVELLQRKNATATLAHSKTKNLKEKIMNADIVFTAVGIKNFISYDELIIMNKKLKSLNKKLYIVDISINSLGVGRKICGDIECNNTAERYKLEKLSNIYITPVPGGIGTTTVASLLDNTISLCINQIDIK